MRLRFTKMHGCGNDFVMIDAVTQPINLTAEKIRFLADRRFGVGCDQILIVEPPSSPDVDFRYRIFNQDGSEVENCGNGARCFAKFVRDRRLTAKHIIRVETKNGLMTLNVLNNGHIAVDMGVPTLTLEEIPFVSQQKDSDPSTSPYTYTLSIDINESYDISTVSMGNPHAVLIVENTSSITIEDIAQKIQQSPEFPNGVNVGFMQILSPQEINLRVYERGVGETLACGTGACAAVVCGQLRGLLDSHVTVNLTGGTLTVDWKGINHPVVKTGPATSVFHGQIKI
ncbi:MAG: diaminopimelate epimerase [Cellvibrionaceae bacterium]